MQGGSKKVELKNKNSTFKAIEKVHPHKMIMFLALFGSLLIIAFMVFAFSVSRVTNPSDTTYVFPKIFTLNTILLLFIAFFINKAIPMLEDEKLTNMKDVLAATLGLSAIFTFFQVIGWLELKSSGFLDMNGSASSFLIVITTFHLFYMVGGLLLLINYLLKIWRLIHDPVKCLITGTNPYEKIKLEMFASYWYSYNVFWLVTFFYFFFTF